MQRPLFVLALAACAAAPTVKPTPPQRFAPAPAPPETDRKSKVLGALPKAQESLAERAKRFPSLAVGVVVGSELVWSRGYGVRDDEKKGEVTAATVFRIGSLTKVLTGAALLLLRDEGKLSFEAPLVETLPELAELLYPTRDSPLLTLRHVVTHTTGLPLFGKFDPDKTGTAPGEADLLADVAGRTLLFPPGTDQLYSNLAVALAGPMVKRITGRPYEAFVTERLLRPLHMTSTVWDAAEVPAERLATGHRREGDKLTPSGAHWKLGAMAPAGGLYSSIEDLAKLLSFELDAWPPRDAPDNGPLRRATLRESQLTYGPTRSGRATFGVAWIVFEEADLGHVVFHNGSTGDYSASAWLAPRRGVGVVCLAGSGDFTMLDGVCRELLGTVATAVPAATRALGKPVKAGLARVIALMAKADEAAVKAAFSERFLKTIPASAVVSTFTAIRADLGASCKEGDPVQVANDTQAVVRVDCDKGSMNVSIGVSADEPYLIELLAPKAIE